MIALFQDKENQMKQEELKNLYDGKALYFVSEEYPFIITKEKCYHSRIGDYVCLCNEYGVNVGKQIERYFIDESDAILLRQSRLMAARVIRLRDIQDIDDLIFSIQG